MVQVKKEDVRDAILTSAFRLFGRKGYTATSMSAIAKAAGVSVANIYVYFGSKLEVLFAIYDPWLRERIDDLGTQLAHERNGHRRLRMLLGTLWQDIPAERNGFANNLIQALSSEGHVENYSPQLLEWMELRISTMIAGALPPERRSALAASAVTHIIMMAFDGFVLNYHLKQQQRCTDETIDLMVHMLMGTLPARVAARATP